MNAEGLGKRLRDAREARELTLEEVEQTLRIRVKFLEAFEAGAYENLPGAVQARGFLRNYARYLNLNPDDMLSQFDAILAESGGPVSAVGRAAEVVASPESPIVVSQPPPGQLELAGGRSGQGRRIGIIVGAIVGLVAIAGLCFGGTQLVERLLSAQAGSGGPDLLNILPTVPSLTPSTTFVPSETPLPGAVVVAEGPPITDRVLLNVSVVQRTWIRVTSDGVLVFEGLVRPGTVLQYQARDALNVQASNGAGLEVVFNNMAIGRLGLRGEAIDTTFTPDLVLTPTPDEAPTATFTPTPLPTLPESEGGATAAGPTPLPIPGQPTQPAGVEPTDVGPTALPLPGVSTQELPPTASPNPTSTVDVPTASPTWTVSPTRTSTVTPLPTITPTPTAVLPPRQTETPIPQK